MILTSSFQKVAETYLGNTGYGNVYIRTYARVTSNGYEIENNRTKVYVEARIYTEGGYWYSNSGTTYSISFSGSNSSGTISCNGRYEVGETVLGTLSGYVNHNDDGTRTIHAECNFTSSPWGWNATASATGVVLPTIPRATFCPNLDGYIESSISITLNPATSNFKHRLYYSYNGKTGYYPSSTEFFTNTGSLDLDTTFYDYTPKSTGTGSLTLYTYNNSGTLIGSKTGTITVRCDKEKCKPLIEYDVVDINPITAQLTAGANTSDIIVKGYSNAQITYEIETRNSATLKSKTVNNTPLGDSPFVINNVDTSEFSIVAIDSRDFDTTKAKPYEIVDYIPLAIALNAFRTSPTGSEIKVNFSGNYFNDNFGIVENKLELSWKYRELRATEWIDGGTLVEGIDYTITEDNKFYSGAGSNVSDISLSTELFPYDKAYEVAIFYKDKIIGVDGTLYTSKPVPKGKPVFNWEEDLFNVNGELTINEKNILELFYPVGSVYISVNPTSPETLFGGSWEQIKDTFLLSAGDTYKAGLTGGEAEHTLTVDEMPRHNHPVRSDKTEGGDSAGVKFSWGTAYTSFDKNATDYVGGEQPHNNMPPYLTVYMWKRTA